MKEWLSWINCGVAVMALLLLLAAFVLTFSSNHYYEVAEEIAVKKREPVSSFEFPQSAYDAIGEPAVKLASTPIGLPLPDLRKTLNYFGKNGRPDADPKTTMMNFGFMGMPGAQAIAPKKPIYILYDKKHKRYEFSPENAETPLWIEVFPDGNQASVIVRIKDENGKIIDTPAQHANFSIPEKALARTDAASWEIGKQRVDGTLLARQRARWYGADRFFERHGGPEYEHNIDRQRIDFGEGEALYSVFVQNGDSLVWDGDRWKSAKPGVETLGKPLMVVKKVEDRLMSFELWDNDGKSKVVLNLLKSPEAAPPANTLQAFKFVGSRTRSQFVFEINKTRVMLSPHDWLLQTDKGWKKLTSVKDIDDYVEGRTPGLLFVFDGVEKRDDRQILMGTLFNKSRSDFQRIEMMMESGASLTPTAAGSPPPQAPQAPQVPPTPPTPPNQPKVPPGEKALELHPHTRTDVREYKKNSR